ncbi:hypothetical protein L7F22_026935 [Adiantum nelumboides]|nr:hypothetical protein [Adiantum nelumboides]MCO5573169.1 hypothetical protein [Adiantum nelumboides]
MNGKDWPNPAANLLSVEAEIREMLSSSGVEVPSCVTGSNSGNILVTLPLPLAALLSLTIAFKVDKFSELVLSVAGPALQNIAGGTSCTAVVAALWSQKVRRWHDFIVFGSAINVIKKDKTTASQVLRSCFSMTLGTTNNLLTSHGGNGALLGHTNWIHPPSGGRGPIPPGILFLRICPSLHDIMFLPGEIITQLVKSVREVSVFGTEGGGSAATLKSGSRLRCLQSSFATTVSRVSQASTLSASLLFVSGGSTLGQLLYSEVLPAWFLTGQKLEGKPIAAKSGNTTLLEGYAVAYFTVLSGLLVWGGSSEPKGQESVKMAAVSSHMRFLASALDGKMSLACELTTWKAYVKSFISLVLACASGWIMYVDVETLRRIAVALRTWHDYDLALALLESGGTATMHIASEFALSL